MKAFAREARDFDDGYWLMLIHDGSNKLRSEYCEDNNRSLCYLQAVQGHSWRRSNNTPELMNYTLIFDNWKEHIYHRGISWNLQSILESGLVSGGQENDRARKSVFSTAMNPFGKDSEEEEPRNYACTIPEKQHNETHNGNAIKMRYFYLDCQEHRVKDCDSGRQNHLQS